MSNHKEYTKINKKLEVIWRINLIDKLQNGILCKILIIQIDSTKKLSITKN